MFSPKGDGEASLHTSLYAKNSDTKPCDDQNIEQNREDSNGAVSPAPVSDKQLLMRLQADVNSLSLVNTEQSQVGTNRSKYRK